MAEITFNATEVKEYRDGSLQTSETIRMGTQYSGSGTKYWYHDVVIVLDLPRSLKKLTVTQKWRSHQSGAASYDFSAALTQEERTTAPDTADVTYTFPGNTATITFDKKLKKGRWYLWLWRHNKSAPSFMYGDRGSHPELTIMAETAGGVVKVKYGGEVKDAVPKVYMGGEWKDLLPKAYKSGAWKELS